MTPTDSEAAVVMCDCQARLDGLTVYLSLENVGLWLATDDCGQDCYISGVERRIPLDDLVADFFRDGGMSVESLEAYSRKFAAYAQEFAVAAQAERGEVVTGEQREPQRQTLRHLVSTEEGVNDSKGY